MNAAAKFIRELKKAKVKNSHKLNITDSKVKVSYVDNDMLAHKYRLMQAEELIKEYNKAKK